MLANYHHGAPSVSMHRLSPPTWLKASGVSGRLPHRARPLVDEVGQSCAFGASRNKTTLQRVAALLPSHELGACLWTL